MSAPGGVRVDQYGVRVELVRFSLFSAAASGLAGLAGCEESRRFDGK